MAPLKPNPDTPKSAFDALKPQARGIVKKRSKPKTSTSGSKVAEILGKGGNLITSWLSTKTTTNLQLEDPGPLSIVKPSESPGGWFAELWAATERCESPIVKQECLHPQPIFLSPEDKQGNFDSDWTPTITSTDTPKLETLLRSPSLESAPATSSPRTNGNYIHTPQFVGLGLNLPLSLRLTTSSRVTKATSYIDSPLSKAEAVKQALSVSIANHPPLRKEELGKAIFFLSCTNLIQIIDKEWMSIVAHTNFPRLLEPTNIFYESKAANSIRIFLVYCGLQKTIEACSPIHLWGNSPCFQRYTPAFRERAFSSPIRIGRLRCALRMGLDCLATTIINFDMLDFGGRNLNNDQFQDVVNVLASMGTETIEALIDGKAHNLLHSLIHRLPNQFFIGDCPTIYCLVVCNEKGATPSWSVVKKAIERMEQYIEQPDEKQFQFQSRCKLIHSQAFEIDNVASGDSERKWLKQERDGSLKLYKLGERRYIPNSQTRSVIKEFCKAMKERLLDASVRKEGKLKALPWAITNIGWTRNAGKRDLSHRSHDNSHCLKNLFESTLALSAPGRGFFARMIRLMHPLTPKQAAVAEHVVSILAGSYHFYGGLNGCIGGNGVEASAGRIPPKVWQETCEKVGEQGVFMEMKGRASAGCG